MKTKAQMLANVSIKNPNWKKDLQKRLAIKLSKLDMDEIMKDEDYSSAPRRRSPASRKSMSLHKLQPPRGMQQSMSQVTLQDAALPPNVTDLNHISNYASAQHLPGMGLRQSSME